MPIGEDDATRTYSAWTCIDWYDGPIEEIAVVTFNSGHKLVEIKAQHGWVGEDFLVRGRDGHKVFYNHMRLNRETLVAMLDLLDGNPVKDFHDP